MRSHGLSSVGARGEILLFLFLLIRPPVLSDWTPTLMTLPNFNYFLKALAPNVVTLRVRSSTYELGGGAGEGVEHNLVHSSGPGI